MWYGGTKFFVFVLCVRISDVVRRDKFFLFLCCPKPTRTATVQSHTTPHHTTGESGVESDALHASLPAPQRRARGPRSPTALYCEVYVLAPPPLPVRCPNGRSRSNGVCTPHPCNPCASRHPHGFFKPAASRRVRERASPRHAGHLTTLVSFQAARAGEQANSLSSICVFFFEGEEVSATAMVMTRRRAALLVVAMCACAALPSTTTANKFSINWKPNTNYSDWPAQHGPFYKGDWLGTLPSPPPPPPASPASRVPRSGR